LADGGEAFLAQGQFLAVLQGLLRFLSPGHFLLKTLGPNVDEIEYFLVALAQDAGAPAAGEPPCGENQGEEKGGGGNEKKRVPVKVADAVVFGGWDGKSAESDK
jgi:hypothetical protein